MLFGFLAWFGLLLNLAVMSLAHAAEERLLVSDIERIESGGVLHLRDGERLCLVGLWVPADTKLDDVDRAWRDVIGELRLVVADSPPPQRDRYGCSVVRLRTDDGDDLADILLRRGLAAVAPASAANDPLGIDAMLALERQARQAGRGFWNHPAMQPKDASGVSSWIGTRQIVEGRVRRVSSNDRYVYLNFGADWRTDFTVRLDRSLVVDAGAPERFVGERLRVRGFVQEARGPLIDVSHLYQIELMP